MRVVCVIAEVPLGDTCTSPMMCKDPNADCTGICECQPQYYRDGDKCKYSELCAFKYHLKSYLFTVVRAFAHGAMGLKVILHGGPMNYFSFQPVSHDWCNKGCVILSVGWCI